MRKLHLSIPPFLLSITILSKKFWLQSPRKREVFVEMVRKMNSWLWRFWVRGKSWRFKGEKGCSGGWFWLFNIFALNAVFRTHWALVLGNGKVWVAEAGNWVQSISRCKTGQPRWCSWHPHPREVPQLSWALRGYSPMSVLRSSTTPWKCQRICCKCEVLA